MGQVGRARCPEAGLSAPNPVGEQRAPVLPFRIGVMAVRESGRMRVFTLAWTATALVLLAGAAALLHSRGAPASGLASRPHPRNVLLLVVDTLRSNRLSCYGYPRPTSPNIDRLASRGTLYRRNYSQACWTLPSMVSMMTGASVVEEVKALPPGAPTLGEALHESGLETAGFVANGVLGKASGFGRGYDVYEAPASADAVTLAGHFVGWHEARRHRAEGGEKVKPFFAWVQFIDPHQPYEPDAAHDVFHGPRLDQERLIERLEAMQARASDLSPDPATPSLEQAVTQATEESNRYDGEVFAVDDGVGRILAELDHGGDLENTLVILCADHGEMLYEHPQQPLIVKSILDKYGRLPKGVLDLFGCGHRPWYYEDLWNTPLIVAGPGMPSGAVRTGLTANLDIFATVLDALGLPSRKGLEGRSLWGGLEPGREQVFAYGHETNAVVEAAAKKLILHPRRFFLLPEGAPDPVEMHDLKSDPREEVDIAEKEPQEKERLTREIAAWRARSPRLKAMTVGEEQMRLLKKLGYVDGDHDEKH